MSNWIRMGLVGACLLASPWALAQQAQGVSKDEIRVGTIQDLSGPLAGFGKQARNGMQMRVDEINAKGGINGRKIKLIVEDSGYDPKKAVLAAQKLVNQDKIFLMAGHMGTAPNMAAMPIQFSKGVINWFPITAAREMYEPLHKLKYSSSPTYYDQARLTGPVLIKEKGAKKACIIYQDDEFGLEVLRGAEAGLKEMNMSLTEKTSFKRGATDFSSQVAKMKAAACDFVFLGTIIRETIGTVAESRKTGFDPVFFGTSAAYTDLIHKLGGAPMNGIYASMMQENPYIDDHANPELRAWATKYKEQFKEDAAVFSVYGYVLIDNFAQIAAKAGAGLTTDSYVKQMENASFGTDYFGSPPLKFSPTNHLGNNRTRVSQIVDGRWKVVKDYQK